ncbi:hypothetical protein NA57DRAFT_76164 [Rhizodiscina lignyota]|uniref:Uncharacterized protein n=1 Tax=Rhizodiscina lignyota TaxID=1504668 RepID=A0A9P4ICA6_9PEZI|nr:hypothetical protein NA57DRAFT_76164 [Rhizodiscina lignyota]
MAGLLSIALFALLGTSMAAPAVAPEPTKPTIVDFNLVSTQASSPDLVTPALDGGRAITLFDPFNNDEFFLSLGHNKNLPVFELSGDSLSAKAKEPFTGKDITYHSEKLVAGQPVKMSRIPKGSSGMSFNGDLITVGADAGDFQMCSNVQGHSVIYYKAHYPNCEEFSFLQVVPRSEVL